MARPRVLILRAPGTNCDGETAFAFQTAGGETTSLHVAGLLDAPGQLSSFQVLCLPGGFSYGDDIAAGMILANQIRTRLSDAIRGFREAGKLVLGICNGFQSLVRAGILLDEERAAGEDASAWATLAANESGKFEDRWVRLRTTGSRCVFLSGIESMYLPIAHGEGRFVARDAATLARLEARGQLVLRYATADGAGAATAYPDNPNGSQASVAGVCDVSGRVFGLMPHPERHIDRTHHPRWTRGEGNAEGDGLQLSKNAVRYFR